MCGQQLPYALANLAEAEAALCIQQLQWQPVMQGNPLSPLPPRTE